MTINLSYYVNFKLILINLESLMCIRYYVLSLLSNSLDRFSTIYNRLNCQLRYFVKAAPAEITFRELASKKAPSLKSLCLRRASHCKCTARNRGEPVHRVHQCQREEEEGIRLKVPHTCSSPKEHSPWLYAPVCTHRISVCIQVQTDRYHPNDSFYIGWIKEFCRCCVSHTFDGCLQPWSWIYLHYVTKRHLV